MTWVNPLEDNVIGHQFTFVLTENVIVKGIVNRIIYDAYGTPIQYIIEQDPNSDKEIHIPYVSIIYMEGAS